MLLRMSEVAREHDDLAALLQRAMAERDVSQSELSRRTGIPVSTINAWIRRTRRATDPDYLRAVAERGQLGLTAREVFAAAEQPLPAPPDAEREGRIVELWRGMSEAEQAILEATAEAISRNRVS